MSNLVEVEVLLIDWLPNRAAARVVAVKPSDVANRPYTFDIKLHDAEDIFAGLRLVHKDSTEPLILEIEERFLIPLIRRKVAIEPVPGPASS